MNEWYQLLSGILSCGNLFCEFRRLFLSYYRPLTSYWKLLFARCYFMSCWYDCLHGLIGPVLYFHWQISGKAFFWSQINNKATYIWALLSNISVIFSALISRCVRERVSILTYNSLALVRNQFNIVSFVRISCWFIAHDKLLSKKSPLPNAKCLSVSSIRCFE